MRAVPAGIVALALAVAAALAVSETGSRDDGAAATSTAEIGVPSRAHRVARPRRSSSGAAWAAGERDADPAEPDSVARSTTCRITARVTAPGGEPVESAEIRIVGAFGVALTKAVAADGSFEADVEATGAVRCIARAKGRVAVASAWATAAPGGAIDAGPLVLAPGGRIAGTVVTSRERRLTGVHLRCEPADPEAQEEWVGVTRQDWSCGARTLDDGAFELSGLPPGLYRVRISPPGRCPWWSDGEIVAAGEESVVLRMPEEYAPRRVGIEVRAEDTEGIAIPDFRASLSAWQNSEGASAESGSVELALTETPPFTLCVRAEGFATATIENVEERGQALVVRMSKELPDAPRLVVSGVVEFEGAALADGDRVELQIRAQADTGRRSDPIDTDSVDDAGGEFVLRPRAAGSYRISADGRVTRDGRTIDVMGRAEVASGDGGVRIRVLPKSSIAGAVRLPEDAEPDELWVTVTDVRQGGVTRTEKVDSNRREFLMPGLPSDGAFRVGVSIRVGAEWMLGRVADGVVAGGPPLEFEFEPGLALSGVVVRADGSPVAGARVWTLADRPHYRIAPTDVDGRFRLTGLRPGTEQLVAASPGLEIHRDSESAAAGASDVRLVVEPIER